MSDCTIKLSSKQTKHLKHMYTTATAKVARRAHIVLLRSQGRSNAEIAEICLCNRDTIADTLQRFDKQAYAGLYDRPIDGRPSSLSPDDVLWLLTTIRRNPHELGYWATIWTIPLMVQALQEQRGKTVSSTAVRNLLHRQNWEFRRPKHIPPSICPLLAAEKDEILRLLLAPRANEVLIFGDEADFEWLPYLSGAWMPKGEQLQIPTPGKNQVLCSFGFFNPQTKEFFYKLVRTRHNKTAKNFIAALHQLRARYPGRVIHLVIDNASIHDPHTKLLKQFRNTYAGQVVIHFLPKHTPILNPIERFWRFLKHRICGNWLYESLDDLVDSFRSFTWQYREHNVVYNFSLPNLVSIWRKHPTIEEHAQAS